MLASKHLSLGAQAGRRHLRRRLSCVKHAYGHARSCSASCEDAVQQEHRLKSVDLTAGRSQELHSSRNGFMYTPHFQGTEGDTYTAEQVIQALEPGLLPDRALKLQQVCHGRTFSVLPVLEGLNNQGNLAAISRTADALGFGAVHCIDSKKKMRSSKGRHSAGAEKWIDMHFWPDVPACFKGLRDLGFRVAVTHLTHAAVSITEVDWTQPTAFVLGNENLGVSEEAVEHADLVIKVPMQPSFVDSYNVSVAAAIIMYQAREQRLAKLGRHGDLTPEQRDTLHAIMLLRNRGSVRRGPLAPLTYDGIP